MCGSEELIHDARQVDLEEAIKMNKTPMYLVPGRLTDEQRMIANEAPYKPDRKGSALEASIAAIGTPIQPCADVETVGFVPDKSNLFVDKRLPMTNIYRSACEPWPVPLVRRTDMEAQVARVAAEKDAEIKRLKTALSDIWGTLLQATESESPSDNLVASALKVLRWSDAAINGRPVE